MLEMAPKKVIWIRLNCTGDNGLVPGQEICEAGVGIVEHEVILGARQAHEVDGGGARRHREVGRGRAVRRPVVQPVVAAAAAQLVRLARARARDLDHQVCARAPACQALRTTTTINTPTVIVATKVLGYLRVAYARQSYMLHLFINSGAALLYIVIILLFKCMF